MNATLKPLTAYVVDEGDDKISITVKNDRDITVIGPLIHHHMSERGIEVINDHIRQFLNRDLNVTKVVSSIPGVMSI